MRKKFLRFAIASVCCLLNATANGDDSTFTFWGSVDYQDFGETSVPLIEAWDHKLTSTQLGFDAHVADAWLMGAAVSWSRDEHDTSLLEDLDSTLTGIHPHLVWSAPDGQLDWWVAVDYGKGDFDISGFDARLNTDIEQGTTKIGASRLLLQRGETEWRLKGEVQHARVEVDDNCGDGLVVVSRKLNTTATDCAWRWKRNNRVSQPVKSNCSRRCKPAFVTTVAI